MNGRAVETGAEHVAGRDRDPLEEGVQSDSEAVERSVFAPSAMTVALEPPVFLKARAWAKSLASVIGPT